MVRRRFSAVSNHAALLVPFILRDALRAPQDEVWQRLGGLTRSFALSSRRDVP
jgi:hypothetical protein